MRGKPIWPSSLIVFLCVFSVTMGLNTRHSYKLSVKRATRRRRIPRRSIPSIRACSLGCRAQMRSCKPMAMEAKCKSKLSEKLRALKKLIPPHNGETVKADQLFQETAEYIVLLRTRVVILQKLIEYYGNNPENANAVLL